MKKDNEIGNRGGCISRCRSPTQLRYTMWCLGKGTQLLTAVASRLSQWVTDMVIFFSVNPFPCGYVFVADGIGLYVG